MSDKPETIHTCPYHGGEKVLQSSDDGKSFFCSTCGWHGDAVALLMQAEGISAREAMERQADGRGT